MDGRPKDPEAVVRLSRRALLQTGALSATAQTTARPNILFLMTDQHRYDCAGANGNRIIRTPHLDRLAAAGANFSRAFVQSPVCVPSRVSYFTGRYPHSHKNRVNYTPCDPREVFLQKLLKDGGYQTGSVGKLHYYPPTPEHARSTGFDRVLLEDGVESTEPYSDYVKWRKAHDSNAGVRPSARARDIAAGKNPFRAAVPLEFSSTRWLGMEAARTLREFAASPRPFFLFASFFKPHGPYTVPEPFASLYDGVEIPLPKRVTLADIHKLPLPAQKQILRGRPEYDMDRATVEWLYRSYYGAVSMVDEEIGRILDELEGSGKAQDTIVIFATDHGDQLMEHGLTGKNLFFEASIHTPLFVRYPRRIAPARYGELIEAVDVLPTVLELCGIARRANVEGRSFAPLVTGDRGRYAPREAAFAENVIPEVITNNALDFGYAPGKGVGGILHPDAKMVRTARWKLNYYPGNGGELYDLENDPGEERNLYADAGRQETVKELKAAILDWLITADEADQIAPRWLL